MASPSGLPTPGKPNPHLSGNSLRISSARPTRGTRNGPPTFVRPGAIFQTAASKSISHHRALMAPRHLSDPPDLALSRHKIGKVPYPPCRIVASAPWQTSRMSPIRARSRDAVSGLVARIGASTFIDHRRIGLRNQDSRTRNPLLTMFRIASAHFIAVLLGCLHERDSLGGLHTPLSAMLDGVGAPSERGLSRRHASVAHRWQACRRMPRNRGRDRPLAAIEHHSASHRACRRLRSRRA
jgi:hypothetical protein